MHSLSDSAILFFYNIPIWNHGLKFKPQTFILDFILFF
jgi:hypothetical protein